MEEKKEATSTVVVKEQFVNARELHTVLQTKSRFNDWISNRISDYGFVEEKDFFVDNDTTYTKTLVNVVSLSPTSAEFDTTFTKSSESDNCEIEQGRPGKIFILTLDMAKELAMVERSDIGRKVRRYFIEVEKRFKEISENLAKRQRERFSLKNELARIETQMSVYSLRKKEITKELDAIDNDMFIQLELFPRP